MKEYICKEDLFNRDIYWDNLSVVDWQEIKNIPTVTKADIYRELWDWLHSKGYENLAVIGDFEKVYAEMEQEDG